MKRCRRHPTKIAAARTTFHYGDGTSTSEYLCADCQSVPPKTRQHPLAVTIKPLHSGAMLKRLLAVQQ